MTGAAPDPASAELIDALETFPDRLTAAVRGAAGRPVSVGEWAPAEVVRHLIAVETEVHQARLLDLATTPSPRWDWVEPAPWRGEPELTTDQLLARFAALRTTTIETVRALDDAGRRRTGTHSRLGVWDVAALLRNAATHDEEHLTGLLAD